MGTLFGARLRRAGYEVFAIDRDEKRAKALSESGIELEETDGTALKVHIPVLWRGADAWPADIVMIFVKSYDTEGAVRSALHASTPNTIFVTLQNGIGNVEKISEIVGVERVVGGITSEGSLLLSPGRARHTGEGKTILALPSGSKADIRLVSSVLSSSGFETEIWDDLESAIWGKAIINAAINPVGALTGLPNGALAELEETRDLMASLSEEGSKVARAKGIQIPFDDPFQTVLDLCRATARNLNSMLQDLLRGRRTEIDSINGAIIREGEAMGVKTPANLVVYKLIKALERTRGDTDRWGGRLSL